MVLSLVDAGAGILCYPTLPTLLILDLMLLTECWKVHAMASSFRIVTVVSLSVVSALSIERYFGVVHPLIYRQKVSKRKLLRLLVGTWSVFGILLLVGILLDNPFQLFGTISVPLLVVVTVYTQIRIAYTAVNAKMKRLRLTEGQDSEQNRKDKLHFLKELKSAMSCLIVVSCYVLCYIPASVLGILKNELSPSTYYFGMLLFLLFMMLNSILNSVIFFWRSAPLRKETKNTLKNIKKSFHRK
jgi:hypothetical protein